MPLTSLYCLSCKGTGIKACKNSEVMTSIRDLKFSIREFISTGSYIKKGKSSQDPEINRLIPQSTWDATLRSHLPMISDILFFDTIDINFGEWDLLK